MSEDIRCECGVFGIFGAKSAAQMTYFGLYALQHRGQEGAGIVTFDGTQLHEVRGQGEVADSSTVGSDSPNCKGSGDRSQPLLHHRIVDIAHVQPWVITRKGEKDWLQGAHRNLTMRNH